MNRKVKRAELADVAHLYCVLFEKDNYPFFNQDFCDKFASAYSLYPITINEQTGWHREQMNSRHTMREAAILFRAEMTLYTEFEANVKRVTDCAVRFYNKRLSLWQILFGMRL